MNAGQILKPIYGNSLSVILNRSGDKADDREIFTLRTEGVDGVDVSFPEPRRSMVEKWGGG